MLGIRVLRGPDWSSGECDGGEGHVGTVVQVDKAGKVDVTWDNGQRRTCIAGEKGKCELRIFDTAPVGIRHIDYTCTQCGERGIFGMRWMCKDVNLCSICYVLDKGDTRQPFTRFDYPGHEGVLVKKRCASQRVQAMGMFPRAIVVRGDDWERGDEDGGRGSKGTVMAYGVAGTSNTQRGSVKVRWDKYKGTITLHQYRVGQDGMVDLKFVEGSPGIYYYKEHLPTLDVTKATKTAPSNESIHVGDQVCIHLDPVKLKAVQMDSGGWVAPMEDCIGHMGTVKGFSGKGDVLVNFGPYDFRMYPGALTKVPKLAVGDTVRVMSDVDKVKVLQKRHRWNDNMVKFLGKVGKVVKRDDAGTVAVAFGQYVMVLNPACCIPAPGQPVFTPVTGEVQLVDEEDSVGKGTAGFHEALMHVMGALLLAGQARQRSVTINDLYSAIAQGSDSGVKSVLGKKKDLVHESYKGVTPLILASHEGQLEMVKVMLDSGADIDKKDHKENTPLIAALIGRRELVAKLLIEKGASVKATNKKRQSCAHLAAYSNLSEALLLIIKGGADVNTQDNAKDTPLHDAIHKGSTDCISLLLRTRTINLKLPNSRGMMALHFAALKNNIPAVDLIIQRDKSLVTEYRLPKDYAPLHIAVVNDHVEVARLLIVKGGCPVDIIGVNGRSPLHVTAIEAHLRSVELLVNEEAQLDLKDADGNTALHMALGAKRSNEEGEMTRGEVECRVKTACFLMERGATYNHKNKQGRTPLEVIKNPYIRKAIETYVKQHEQNLKTRPATPQPGRGRRPAPAASSSSSNLFTDFALPCSGCYKTMSDAILKPCGHKVLCRTCCASVDICPMCETPIELRLADSRPGDDEDSGIECKIQ